ncbi:interferon-induced very large GTPase 1-like isoform X2 [Osmerus eperlanus]
METIPHHFLITYSSPGTESQTTQTADCCTTLTDLLSGTQYTVGVSTVLDHGGESEPVNTTICTSIPPPDKLTVVSVDATETTLPHNLVSPGTQSQTTQTADCCTTLTDLLAGTHYTVGVSTVLDHGGHSEPASTTIITDSILHRTLESLGIRCFLDNKLTVDKVREIGEDAASGQTATDRQSQVLLFLRRLLMMNMKARSLTWHNNQDSGSNDSLSSEDEEVPDEDINPLDLITALFLCSDGILQQELSLKLSLCQFAVPLLLPNPETQQSTLMLWAMRDIVKQSRPHTPGDSKEYVEKSIVDTEIPLISFVRLGSSSLSKSKFLNELLSNSSQINSTFVHHNMTDGNTPRQISDGLVETSWYLPSGDPGIDVFSEPVAVANLRGDLQKYQTQFAFLSQISSAVFVFCDDLRFDASIVRLQSMKKRKLFVVCDSQSQSHDKASFKKLKAELKKNSIGVIKKDINMNDAALVKKLRSAVKDVLKSKPLTVKGNRMADVAHELGIIVDEDYSPCKSAKSKADKITANVFDIPEYKDRQLPLQQDTWKKLTALEKEECKLKKAGDKDIDKYKKELMKDKETLRKKQVEIGMSPSIKDFIAGLKTSEEERSYFLKWMKINLDDLSSTRLSDLRRKYRDICQKSPERKDLIANLDEQILNSSLGTEHFFREVGQLYEAAMFSADPKQELQELPRICAELMLASSPLELMDGDTSNIPMKWITNVLKELDSLTKPNNKIKVITVLGVQSSGKSTLLNTMFGVQFAVSSGRCTRGAFMQLIKVKHEFRDEIKCDFIMIIDTEGLKAVKLSQITDNCEHDNELATLVIGLSHFSIVNIAMENSLDMRDLLQIVAHAFIRMRESGKMPCCQFVHQNVTDISAPDKNLRDQNLLLEQLNEMTRVASKMEKIDECDFTDIIMYKPEENCNIPGLWHGSPPMAPVNEGYSAAVAKLKQQLINTLKLTAVQSAQTLPEFCQWLEQLWAAVKKEKFIFSFRNTLVAQAYKKLCVEFSRWERNFQKHMYDWLMTAEIRVANYGLNESKKIDGLCTILQELRVDSCKELKNEQKVFINNIEEYYKKEHGNVDLIEKYREEFKISAENQVRLTDMTVKRKLDVAVEVRKCTFKLDHVKRTNRETLDKKVSDLVKRCDRGDQPMTDQEIEQEFEKMWDKTIEELSMFTLEHQNVALDIYNDLNMNFGRECSNILAMLENAKPIDKCGNGKLQILKDEHYLTMTFKKALSRESYENEKIKASKTQELADEIINKCKMFIANKLKERKDYHSTHTRELLDLIEENLRLHSNLNISAENAAALKIHICGYAAREFQSMHDAFIRDNDPRQNLEKLKPQYLKDFKDLYDRKDLCNRKADEFTNQSIKPAIISYINNHLGQNILEVLSNCGEFRSRTSFQFSMMKSLISSDFPTFQKCIDSYDEFSNEFTLNSMVRHLSNGNSSLANIQVKLLKEICCKIKKAVSQVSQKIGDDGNDLTVIQFIQELVSELSSVLVILNETTGLKWQNSKTEEFSNMFKECIPKMENGLIKEFHNNLDILETLSSLPDPPQDQLYSRLLGCGKQCPYCKAPCNVEGKTHTKHCAFHRPEGLGDGRWRSNRWWKLPGWILDNKIQTEKCVFRFRKKSGLLFINSLIFPLYVSALVQYLNNEEVWNFQPFNSTISGHWKFLLVKHNKEYADNHSALPADIPEDWKEITSEQALQSLTEEYYPDTEDQLT